MTEHRFPDGFLWGVATAAQQIEGARHEGGRGDSIWDRYADIPGNIADGSSPSIACDHYRRWPEDVLRLRWLGVGAYRFSTSWSRVFPNGHPPENTRGLDFYDALVDGLLESGIRPFVTLNHWDLPQALQELGGWPRRSTVEAFVHYADAVSRRLGDRVKDWITHNEPWCIATLGHEIGHHAPGHRDPAESLRVAHHLLLSHGHATRAIRANCSDARVGIALNLVPVVPASTSAADAEATRQVDALFNRWYLDPLFRGHYPEDAIQDRHDWGHLEDTALPFVLPGDLECIATTCDFLGVNYYSRNVIQRGGDGKPHAVKVVPRDELTDMEWEVYPQGLYDILWRLKCDYDPPQIFITENGVAYGDCPDTQGRVHDGRRIEFIRRHLVEAQRALHDGVPLAGYFLWSLMDNFEWSHGYDKRFGLFWVDYATQRRLPKDSAHWYGAIVAAHAVQERFEPNWRMS